MPLRKRRYAHDAPPSWREFAVSENIKVTLLLCFNQVLFIENHYIVSEVIDEHSLKRMAKFNPPESFAFVHHPNEWAD